MIKKIALLLTIAILPITGMMAQSNLKIGHVNSQELMETMPEVENMRKELKKAQDELEATLLKMREEYFAKIEDFQKNMATMSESLKKVKQSELSDMENRITTLTQTSQQELQKKQQELIAPIIAKVTKAINEVAAENGYTYVFDLASQSIVYNSPSANDLNPLVKKKLNLK